MNELLLAADPQELVQAQRMMIRGVDDKIVLAIREAKAAAGMRDQMLSAGLNSKQAKTIHQRATDRVAYLVRVKAALEAGYVMMPDMPGDVIAVRSVAETPGRQEVRDRDWSSGVPDHPADWRLPLGVNRYVSPRQEISRRKVDIVRTQHDGTKKNDTKDVYWATGLRDPDGLHKTFVRPQVISRVSGAMMAGIFDEIVTVRHAPRQRKNRDPIVLGRILNGQVVSAFLIAWFMDMSEL